MTKNGALPSSSQRCCPYTHLGVTSIGGVQVPSGTLLFPWHQERGWPTWGCEAVQGKGEGQEVFALLRATIRLAHLLYGGHSGADRAGWEAPSLTSALQPDLRLHRCLPAPTLSLTPSSAHAPPPLPIMLSYDMIDNFSRCRSESSHMPSWCLTLPI